MPAMRRPWPTPTLSTVNEYAAMRVCIDRPTGSGATRRAPVPRLRLAVPVEKKWINGRQLRVGFLDGATELHERIAAAAEAWTAGANIDFDWGVSAAEADLRVTFQGVGSWSQIGTDARKVPAQEPTICLGWLTPDSSDDLIRQTALHEFGHALGAVHEHQSPAGGVPWNRPAVYRFYAGPPNLWSKIDVDQNLFTRYDQNATQFSEFDPNSIMIYPIPKELTVGEYSVDWGTDLSSVDRSWMGVVYPYHPHGPFELVIDGPAIRADIGEHGEWDEFHFRVAVPEEVVVETAGPTDVVVALAGPDDPERIVAQDDDSGLGHNARLSAVVSPGSYVVRVWHHWPTGVGEYELTVRTA